MSRLTIILFMLLGIGIADAQQVSSKRPEWVDGYFLDLPNTYIEVVKANGTDRSIARDRAAQIIIKHRDRASGGEYKVHVNGQNIEVSGDGTLIVKARVLDEYAEYHGNGNWEVSLLVQTAKNPTNEYELVRVTDNYSFSPRAFVPGMQQLYKGQKTKGIAFIAAEAICVGGVIASESIRSNNETLIGSTRNAKERTKYTDNVNNWSNIRNGFIAGATIVYIWNVIDAASSKGPRHVEVLSLSPYATQQTYGLALNVRF